MRLRSSEHFGRPQLRKRITALDPAIGRRENARAVPAPGSFMFHMQEPFHFHISFRTAKGSCFIFKFGKHPCFAMPCYNDLMFAQMFFTQVISGAVDNPFSIIPHTRVLTKVRDFSCLSKFQKSNIQKKSSTSIWFVISMSRYVAVYNCNTCCEEKIVGQ